MISLILASVLGLGLSIFEQASEDLNYISLRAKKDREVAREADRISSDLNRALVLNTRLHELSLLCLGATPALAASLKIEGEILARKQDLQMTILEEYLLGLRNENELRYQAPHRKLGTCAIPGVLQWPSKEILALENSLSGVAVETLNFGNEVRWNYKNENVQRL